MTSSIKDIALKMLTPNWVLCVVILMICNQLVILIRQLWLPVERPIVSFARGTGPQMIDTSNKMTGNYQFNLFGTVLSPTGNVEEESEASLRDAPLSTLKINVTGIVASSTPADSIAIIAKGNKQFSFGIGDKIPEYDARIAAIFTDHIVINYQGRNESLLLDSGEDTVIKDHGDKNQSVSEQVAASFARQPQDIFNILSISPVMINNKLNGYRLNPGANSQLFQRVGLQKNDLAVALNGLDLRDTEQAQQIIEQLSELKEIKITVDRNGQLHDIFVAVGDN